MQPKTALLHGRSVIYTEVGTGPVLLLIHGMGGSYENWQAVIEPLARREAWEYPNAEGSLLSPSVVGFRWTTRLPERPACSLQPPRA